jgi:hypothetical protein
MTAHVVVGTGTAGTRFVKTNYPLWDEDNHLTLGTTRLSETPNLVPQTADLVHSNEKVGLE